MKFHHGLLLLAPAPRCQSGSPACSSSVTCFRSCTRWALELVSLALPVSVASAAIRDAESNWLEGAFLLIAYAMIAVAFWFF